MPAGSEQSSTQALPQQCSAQSPFSSTDQLWPLEGGTYFCSDTKRQNWQWTAHCYTQDSILLCVLLSQVLVLGQKPVKSFEKPQTSLKCETHVSCTKSFNQKLNRHRETSSHCTRTATEKKKKRQRQKFQSTKWVQKRYLCQIVSQFMSFLIPEAGPKQLWPHAPIANNMHSGQSRNHSAFSSIIL